MRYDLELTLEEAFHGKDATIEVPTLQGSKKLRVPGGTKSGTVQRLRGEGPQKLSDRARGDDFDLA